MGRGNIVAVFDLGSSSIKAAAGFYRKNGSIKKMAVGEVSAKGIKNGLVTDLDLAAQCLEVAKCDLTKQLNEPLETAWIGVSGGTVMSCVGQSCITIEGPDSEIDEFDLRRAAIAAEVAALPQRREALHIVPLSYTIDGRVQTDNPEGLFGQELSLSAAVISAELVQTQNILRLARRAGLQVNGLLYTPWIAGNALLSASEKANGAIYIDIGAEACDAVLFRHGVAQAVLALPYGGRIIDQDIAYGFKVSLAEAEQLKQRTTLMADGRLRPPEGQEQGQQGRQGQGQGQVELPERPEPPELPEPTEQQRFLNEIISARIVEYLELILGDCLSKGYLSKDYLNQTPIRRIVIGGGTSRWPELAAITQEYAGCPCRTIAGAAVSIEGYYVDAMLAGLFQYCLAQSARNSYNGERFRRILSWLTGHQTEKASGGRRG